RMLEKAADHALDADMFTETRHARSQAADAPYYEVDLHASARGGIQPVDQLRVNERVELSPDGGRLSGLGISNLRIDQGIQGRPQSHRCEGDLLHPFGTRVTRHVIEQARCIAPHHRIAGEEREVRVDAGGDRMIVAGAEV